jgi:hypothetical protein
MVLLSKKEKNIKSFPGHPEFENDTTVHKGDIQNLMFTVATSEPRADSDGKRAMVFHAHQQPAQRNSVNRPRGTLEWVADSVDGDEFYDAQMRVNGIIEQVIDSADPGEETLIQMDNATPHVGNDMVKRLKTQARVNGNNIDYVTQSPNSPDLNICDLCFFNSSKKEQID